MQKLIELLNEREKTINGVQYPGWCKEHLEYQCHGPRVINKRFGFIKWLVENDKIDKKKLDEKAERKPQYTFIDDDGRLGFKLFEVYESLLMLLAIQDEPIRFLCEILK